MPRKKNSAALVVKSKRGRPRKTKQVAPNAIKKTGGRHLAIRNGGQSICNEQVGIHVRVEQGEQAPEEGDYIHVDTGKTTVTLLVRHIRHCVNGETLVQAFTFLKGEYKHLAEVKGELVRVYWKDE